MPTSAFQIAARQPFRSTENKIWTKTLRHREAALKLAKDADASHSMSRTTDLAQYPGIIPHWRKWTNNGVACISGTATRKGALAFADQAVASAVNFCSGIIIGRFCSKEDFGFYLLGSSIIYILTNLQLSLITTPYMVRIPHFPVNGRARYTGSTLIHQMILSGMAIGGMVTGGVFLHFGIGPAGMTPVVRALTFTVLFILLRDYVRQICFANLRMSTAFYLDSVVALLQIGGLVTLVFLGLLSASRAFLIIGFACGASAFIALYTMETRITIDRSQVVTHFRQNWRSGKWIFASAMLWGISVNLYPWILTGYHGAASAGVWAACIGAVSVGNPLVLGLQNFAGPQLAHAYAQDGLKSLRQCLRKTVSALLIVISPFSVILLILGGVLVTFIYGDKYSGNNLIMAILAINLLVTTADFAISRALFAMERAFADFKVNFVALAALLSIGVWLVRSFGPSGAAAGLLAGNLAALMVRTAVFLKFGPRPGKGDNL